MIDIIDQNNLLSINSLLNEDDMINKDDDKFRKLMFLYKSAQRELMTKLEILKEELNEFYSYTPIEEITCRIKSYDSIIKKLNKKGYALTYGNLINNLNDVSGIRIVCNFKDDVYKIAELIESFQDVRILEERDYIKNPKKSGYRSFHLIVEVPVNFSRGIMFIRSEIQIRSLGMNFWSQLEHQINYKSENDNASAKKRLMKYANIIDEIDNKLSILSDDELTKSKRFLN